MILKEVAFQNFKSYKNQKILINNVNILIGKNNSGKSNLLEGLDLFFNYRKKYIYKNLDSFLYKNKKDKSTKLKFYIECIFNIGSKKKISITVSRRTINFDPISKNNEMRIRLVYNRSGEIRLDRDKFGELTVHSKSGKPADVFYEIYNYRSKNFLRLSIEDFGHIFRSLDFLYISAFRDFSNVKVFEQILGRVFDNASTTRKNRIIKSIDSLKNNIDVNLIKGFKSSFNDLISYKLFGDLVFDLRFDAESRGTVLNILKSCTPLLTDSVQTEVKEKGAGMQSFVIIWLYNYLMNLSSKNLILAIEEPESHLHPTAQKNLIEGISKIFKTHKNQIILSTHSPFLIDNTKLEDILYVRSSTSGDEVFSEIRQIKSDSLSKDDKNFFERNLNIESKDIFFSDFVVLVEGEPDKLVFEYLLKLYNFDARLENCSFIPAGGVGNFKYVAKLLSLFKIPFIVVFDRDFVYFKDENSREHYGFLNMCEYTGIVVDGTQINNIKINKGNIKKLNKTLQDLNGISLTIDLEKDLMTNKTMPIFKKVLEDNLITLDKIKNKDYKKNEIKRNIQNMAYEIKNKKDLPRYYQTLLSGMLKKINS